MSNAGRINLDRYFRKDSSARKIAERFMTGEPVNRQAIAQELDVAVTSINRVVAALEEAGVKFSHDVEGRQAVFKMVSIGDPKQRKPYPGVGTDAQIVGLEMIGDALIVEFTADGARFRGRSLSVQQPTLGKGEVTGVNKEDGDVMVGLRIANKQVRLANVANVAEDAA
jgi:biotin operon repressor